MKCIGADRGDAIGHHHAEQIRTTIKYVTIDRCHAIGNRHMGQAAAPRERRRTDVPDAIGYCYAGHSRAVGERTRSDVGDVITVEHSGNINSTAGTGIACYRGICTIYGISEIACDIRQSLTDREENTQCHERCGDNPTQPCKSAEHTIVSPYTPQT